MVDNQMFVCSLSKVKASRKLLHEPSTTPARKFDGMPHAIAGPRRIILAEKMPILEHSLVAVII